MTITAQHLRKSYGTHVALDDAGFEVPDDAGVVVLLGPSGGGKSTLLRVLGCLLIPEAGQVMIDQQALSWSEVDALKQRRSNGFVFQGFNLFPHLSAQENVALPLRVVREFDATAAKQRADEVLARFGMSQHTMKKPSSLSGGQQQRVALARAIAPKPKLLLLDEPTSALDPMMTQEVLDLIRQLALDGQRIVLSTHEIHFARQVADWVIFLDHGRVIESARAKDFFNQPKSTLAQQFIEALTKYH